MIQVDNLSFQTDHVPILKHINLAIQKNEFVGVIGPNGSGKSTLLKNIYRQLKPTEGTVYIGGQEAAGIKSREMARKMAVVGQENSIEFDFTVGEVVRMGRYAHKKLFSSGEKEDDEICQEALEAVGMAGCKERSFLSLSGGEKQRIYLACAFAQKSEIIVLDEPTNHLDIGYQLAMMDTLKKQEDTTILTAVHDMNLAAWYCDRILVMQDGAVIAAGIPEEVLTTKLMRKVFRVETEISRDSNGKMQVHYLGCVK